MDLKEVISISGKNGLYKVVARSNKGFIVESIEDKKTKFPVNANHQVALLDEITIYTNTDENLPLKTVMDNIEAKRSEGNIPNVKDDTLKIKEFFRAVAPDYDEERVYVSDMKKILKWFDILAASHSSES
jgi:hypothetical protein